MALQTKKFVLPKDRTSIWNDSAGEKELGTYHPSMTIMSWLLWIEVNMNYITAYMQVSIPYLLVAHN